jgi:ABC-2 type transport system permease protein
MPLGFLFLFVLIFGHGQTGMIAYILGSVLTITVMGSFWGLSVQLVIFREQGILRRFRLAPVGAGPLLASSILANYVLVLPAVLAEILICRSAFHMNTWGNIPAIFVLVSVGAATFSAFGLIVASVTNSMQETQVINNLIWSAFLFLSGATVPLAVFPHWIQRVALFSPATYLATGLQAATTSLVSGRELVTDSISLIVALVLAFKVSRQIFRWEPEAKIGGKGKLWVLAALIPFLIFGAYENRNDDRLGQLRSDFRMIEMQSGAPRTQAPSDTSPQQ